MYFEGSQFDLIHQGTRRFDPELKMVGVEFRDLREKSARLWTHLNSIRNRSQVDKAFKALFGVGGKQMLQKVLGPDAQEFWNNYRRLAEFRNAMIHKARRLWFRTIENPQDRSAAERMLAASVHFVPTCWVVFSKLWNEYIHKKVLAQKCGGTV